MSTEREPVDQMQRLLEVMRQLRDPESGCPWDLRQDFSTIVPYSLEEVYELVDAIEAEDFEQIADELGDVLFQVVFYAQLGAERGLFDFTEVVQRITDKLVRRHPHVFEARDEPAVLQRHISESGVEARWEYIKQQERQQKRLEGVLDDVPLALPALSRAQKLQKRAARIGFDWPDATGVWVKVDEEIAELMEAIANKDQCSIEAEIGDVLIAVVNLARHFDVDAEAATRLANARFESRFREMERSAKEEGSALESESLDRLEERWQKAKRRLVSDGLAT
jgi:nucleoside triphosphate diphosphatase